MIYPVQAPTPALTPAQARFAEEHDAQPGLPAATGSGIFFYHEEPSGLSRWLVSPRGVVLEAEHFSFQPA